MFYFCIFIVFLLLLLGSRPIFRAQIGAGRGPHHRPSDQQPRPVGHFPLPRSHAVSPAPACLRSMARACCLFHFFSFPLKRRGQPSFLSSCRPITCWLFLIFHLQLVLLICPRKEPAKSAELFLSPTWRSCPCHIYRFSLLSHALSHPLQKTSLQPPHVIFDNFSLFSRQK